MYVDFNMLNEEVVVWLPIHDTKTNTNLTARLCGTVAEIDRLGRKSAELMDAAGFVPGWRATGRYCGSIDYIVLVREAVERAWQASFKMTSNLV